MSPQLSRVGKFPPRASGFGDSFVFGENPQSSVAIPKALIAQIWAQVNEGTHGGLEIGGLLVGPKTLGGRVAVDEIIPLPIEYRHGPAFQMSSTDLAGIPLTVESVQEGRSRTVVGLYRGKTRGDTRLRESDQEIFEAIERAHTSFAADFRCFFGLAPISESRVDTLDALLGGGMALACVTMGDERGWDEMQPFTLRSNPLSMI